MKNILATILLFISSTANSCETYTDEYHLKHSLSAEQIAVIQTLENPKTGKLVVLEVFRGGLVKGEKIQVGVTAIDLKANTAYLVYSKGQGIKEMSCDNTALAEDEFGYDTPIVIEISHRESG